MSAETRSVDEIASAIVNPFADGQTVGAWLAGPLRDCIAGVLGAERERAERAERERDAAIAKLADALVSAEAFEVERDAAWEDRDKAVAVMSLARSLERRARDERNALRVKLEALRLMVTDERSEVEGAEADGEHNECVVDAAKERER